jgi:glycosyltransferase involved in cell wall biosynthesis
MEKSPDQEIRILCIQSRICVGGPALQTILCAAHLPPPFTTLLVGGRLEPGECSMDDAARAMGVELGMIEEMGRSLHWYDDLAALLRLIPLIRRYRPHIVHTHTAKAGFLGRIAAFLCRVPVRIHTFHGHVFEGYFSPSFSRALVWVERMLARISTRIVAISPRQRRDLVERFRIASSDKCRTIPLGFELSEFAGAEPGCFRLRLGLGPQPRLVGILARLVPIKNHGLLIHAIGEWTRLAADPDPKRTRFLIIGDGPCRAELEALVDAQNLRPWIIFTGWQDRVAEIYADLALNVLVSRNEGTPLSLIEGLGAGVPFLATDVGGIRDIYEGPYGRIVPVQVGPPELARALEECLNASGRLPDEERMAVAQRFSRERLIADLLELYREALAQQQILLA